MCCSLHGDFENSEVLLCVSVVRTRGCLRYCFLSGRHYQASPLVGSIGEFDTSTETFTAYHERLEQYSLRIVLAFTLLTLPRLLKQLRTGRRLQ